MESQYSSRFWHQVTKHDVLYRAALAGAMFVHYWGFCKPSLFISFIKVLLWVSSYIQVVMNKQQLAEWILRKWQMQTVVVGGETMKVFGQCPLEWHCFIKTISCCQIRAIWIKHKWHVIRGASSRTTFLNTCKWQNILKLKMNPNNSKFHKHVFCVTDVTWCESVFDISNLVQSTLTFV